MQSLVGAIELFQPPFVFFSIANQFFRVGGSAMYEFKSPLEVKYLGPFGDAMSESSFLLLGHELESTFGTVLSR